MRPHQFCASLAFGLFAAVAACGSHPPPSSAAGVTSAQRTDPHGAAWKLADARCKHAAACNEIGGNRDYATQDACVTENRGKLENDLRAAECPRGVDTTRLSACLSEINAEACSGIGSGFGREMSCSTGSLCP
jgi:hypothetical protein